MARTSRQRSGRTAASVLAALALCATAYPARAEVILNQGTNGTYSIPVMSWWEIPFRSVVRQQYDFSCGSAAVATLLSYHYDRRTPEQAVFASMWDRGDQQQIRKVGFSMLDMKQYLDSIGYRTEGFRLPIDALRKTERPGIVLLDLKGYKHFVVLRKVEGQYIHVGDPALGNRVMKRPEFEQAWNGVVFVILGEGYDPNTVLRNPPPPLSARRLFEQRSPVPNAEVYDFGLGPAYNFIL